jgi:hypothetical protein
MESKVNSGRRGRWFKSSRPDWFSTQALRRERRRACLFRGRELRRRAEGSNRRFRARAALGSGQNQGDIFECSTADQPFQRTIAIEDKSGIDSKQNSPVKNSN